MMSPPLPHAQLEEPLLARELWSLDPQLVFLNHGSFGACPREVLAAQQRERDALERSPVAYYLREAPHKIQEARARFAALLAAPLEGLCLTQNASEGVATALAAVRWRAGDEVVVSRDAYGACLKMLKELSLREGVTVRLAETPMGVRDFDDEEAYERWSRGVIRAFEEQCGPETRLFLIDHITSPTALVYPVEELLELAVHQGALSLIDGAHAPGHVPIELTALKPDFYTGNAHKWLMSPKSCAALYLGERWRAQVKPLVISHGYDQPPSERLHALFDWTGTRDLSAWTTLPFTLDWLEARGGWELIAARNHQLVCAARRLLIEALWRADESAELSLAPERALGQMAALPVPAALTEAARREVGAQPLHPLQEWLYRKGFEVPVIPSPYLGAPDLIRISAQAYNRLADYERLAELLCELRRAA
jgi:isopenicillin-N epimerase